MAAQFSEGDLIMKKGEEASWAGVLLSGELEALLPSGAVIGRVLPGTVVGEMAMFCGGKRGCDMKAIDAGSIAVLRFSSLEHIESVALLHKLMLAFGREAYLHSVNPQISPFSEQRSDPTGSAVFEQATLAMTKRGWTPAELTPLFECLDVSGVSKGASVLIKGRTIDFVVLVIRGAVTHRGKRHLPGEIVGADNVISSYPLLDDATCESDGVLGALSMGKLEALGEAHPNLARKVLRMLGVLALGREFDASESSQSSGGKRTPGSTQGGSSPAGRRKSTAPKSSPAISRPSKEDEEDEESDEEEDTSVGEASGPFDAARRASQDMRSIEIVFRKQLRQQEKQKTTLEENVDMLQRDKTRDEMLLAKARREKEALTAQLLFAKEERRAAIFAAARYKQLVSSSRAEYKELEERANVLLEHMVQNGVDVPSASMSHQEPAQQPPSSGAAPPGGDSKRAAQRAARHSIAGGPATEGSPLPQRPAGRSHSVAGDSANASFTNGRQQMAAPAGGGGVGAPPSSQNSHIGLPSDARFRVAGDGDEDDPSLATVLRARCEHLAGHVERAWGADAAVLRKEMWQLEGELHRAKELTASEFLVEMSRCRARMRWARALAHVSMGRMMDLRVNGQLRFALAVLSATQAEKKSEDALKDTEDKLDRARVRAQKVSDSKALIAHRAEELTDAHSKLQAEHEKVVTSSEAQTARLKQLERRLHLSAGFEEAEAERMNHLELDRTQRLESEIVKLRWQLEQIDGEREKLSEGLRRTAQAKHALGAAHASLEERSAAEREQLFVARGHMKRLDDELEVERQISRERMAKIIEERKRNRILADELAHRQLAMHLAAPPPPNNPAQHLDVTRAVDRGGGGYDPGRGGSGGGDASRARVEAPRAGAKHTPPGRTRVVPARGGGTSSTPPAAADVGVAAAAYYAAAGATADWHLGDVKQMLVDLSGSEPLPTHVPAMPNSLPQLMPQFKQAHAAVPPPADPVHAPVEVADVFGERQLPTIKAGDLMAMGTVAIKSKKRTGLTPSFSQPPSLMMAGGAGPLAAAGFSPRLGQTKVGPAKRIHHPIAQHATKAGAKAGSLAAPGGAWRPPPLAPWGRAGDKSPSPPPILRS